MKTFQNFSDRLLKIFNDFSITSTQFADIIGVQKSTLSHLLSNRNKPSLDLLLKITEHYPSLNLYWLADGSLPIYLNNEVDISSTTLPTNQNKLDGNSDDIASTEEIKSTITFSDETEIDYIVIFYKDGTFKRYLQK